MTGWYIEAGVVLFVVLGFVGLMVGVRWSDRRDDRIYGPCPYGAALVCRSDCPRHGTNRKPLSPKGGEGS